MNIKKQEAVKLREEGYSYSLIKDSLGISKSTLSSWFRDMPFTPNTEVQRRIKSGQATYGLQRHAERLAEIEELRAVGVSEVGEISKRDLWMLGIGLWIGEGSKTIEQIRVVNSDPKLIALWVRWLREICDLEPKNITASMHLYPDSDGIECLKYWQSITKLPTEQFRKTQIDKRLNKNLMKNNKLPYGTLHISVVSNGEINRGVKLYRRLQGWVSGATK